MYITAISYGSGRWWPDRSFDNESDAKIRTNDLLHERYD